VLEDTAPQVTPLVGDLCIHGGRIVTKETTLERSPFLPPGPESSANTDVPQQIRASEIPEYLRTVSMQVLHAEALDFSTWLDTVARFSPLPEWSWI
jgi:hypothetical protein